MTTLILLRHGQSAWNLENRFTGWVDVDLTAEGEAQARAAGLRLKDAGVTLDRAYASLLTRAIRTLWLALTEMGQVYVPITKDWRLNERHYGGLTGLNKAETAAKHGEDQVKVWRRSFDIPPPAMADGDAQDPARDRRYGHIDPAALPKTESLKTTLDRVLPYWQADIAPRVAAGENVVVAAHGNSLRALMKHLFGVSDADIVNVEIPTGNPLQIELEPGGTRLKSARYLDAERAADLPVAPA